MWVGGDTLMLWPMIPVALRWLHLEERRAVRVDREIDGGGGRADGRDHWPKTSLTDLISRPDLRG